MLPAQKIEPALYAIHLAMVQTRMLVLDGADSDRLYKALDWSHSLPAIMARPGEDTTQEFREMLIGLGQACPECAGLISNFDRNVSWYGPEVTTAETNGDAAKKVVAAAG